MSQDLMFKENPFAPLFLINGKEFKWQDPNGRYWVDEYPVGSGYYYNSVNNPARDYTEKTEQLVRSTRNANGQVIAEVINRRLEKFDNLRWPYLSAESVRWLRNQIKNFNCVLTYWDDEIGAVIDREFYWGDFEATPCEWETIEVPAGSRRYFKKPTWYKDVKCNLIDKRIWKLNKEVYMAIKRDNYGNIIIGEFENHLKAKLRQECYIDIIMYTPDNDITISSVTSEDILDICNIDSVADIKKYSNITIATLEENLWLLNDRFPNYQNGFIDGYISNSMSDVNGEFINNPTMKIQLDRPYNIEDFSLILNPAVPTGYPKQIIFHCYDINDNEIETITQNIEWEEQNGVDNENQPIMVTKILDTLPSVNVSINTNNIYYIVAEFVNTRFRHRRIRVSSVMFGKTVCINQNDIINAEYLDKSSFVSDTLPSRTFAFSINNYNGVYDIDNPNNNYIKLDKQTRVQFRFGYNVAGYEYNNDDTVKMENGFPINNYEQGIVEIEWDDWKELRLMDISPNSDKTATFTCGSVLDIMENIYTAEIFEGRDRTVESIVNNVLSFEGLDMNTVEWSSDGIIIPSIIGGNNADTLYKDYLIDTVIPEVQCKQVLQIIAFAIGATILIKDNGKIKFANLNLNDINSFTHRFDWTYNDFEEIPNAEQLETIDDISQISLPKYISKLNTNGDEDRGQSIISTVLCNAINQEVTYNEALINGARIKADDTSGAQISNCTFYAHRGIIRLGGLTPGNPAQVELIGYPIETQQIQEIDVTSDSLVLDTQIMKNDPTQYNNQGIITQTECIKHKYLEWYKKKFKYTIKTRGEPLVDAGDYGVIQTQFTGEMPVYILQNHWVFDGGLYGDMEVIALG